MQTDLDFDNNRDATLELIRWFELKKVRAARILVVGAGAIGNEVLKNLALLGAGSDAPGGLFIIDRDTIELSNLSRSVLYREKDQGGAKAEVAGRAVLDINPGVRAYWLQGDLEIWLGEGVVRSMDVIIGCLDNLQARFVLNRVCCRAGKRWVDAGIDDLCGRVCVFEPAGPCFECSLTSDDFDSLGLGGGGCGARDRRATALGRIPTTPMMASLVAALQVQEGMKLLSPGEWAGRALWGREFFYDGAGRGGMESSLSSREGCWVHAGGGAGDVLVLNDLTAAHSARDLIEALRTPGVPIEDEIWLGQVPGPGGMGGGCCLWVSMRVWAVFRDRAVVGSPER